MSEGLDPEAVDGAPLAEIQESASPVGPPAALAPERIEHLVHLLDTNPEAALRAQIAHRANLPFSEVVERWSMEDLAWELAITRKEIDRVRHRCPSCGIDPRDQLTPWGRLGENPSYRLEVRRCPFCEEQAELQAKLNKEPYKRSPPSVYYVPAEPGEPFLDEGQIPTPVPIEPASEEQQA